MLDKIFKNPIIAAAIAFGVIEYLPYVAFTGQQAGGGARRDNMFEAITDWQSGAVGHTAAGIILAILGVVGAWYVYRRISRLNENS